MAGYNQQQKPTDWKFGGYTGIKNDICNPLGQWLEYIPQMETQVYEWDTWGCVTFSTLNCLEILHKYLTGIEENWSDRFIIVLSGTQPNGGNSLQVVADTIRDYGLVSEMDCPVVGRDKYYTIYQSTKDKGRKFLDNYAVNYEFVRPERETYQQDVMDALMYSPLAVGVAYADGEGVLNPKGNQNHFVALVGYKKGEYWIVADSYRKQIKHYSWDYRFAGIAKFKLTIKQENMLNLREGMIYLLVEGKEQKAGIAVDGNLMVGEKIDVLLNSAGRNGGFMANVNVIPVSLADWNSVNKTDLKGNKL